MSEAGPSGETGELPLAELVRRLRDSPPDRASVYAEEIIRRFEPLLRRAWRHGAFQVEYPDFVQDVFLRLFRDLPGLRDARAFPGYFRRVAFSVAASHGRTATRRPHPEEQPQAVRFHEVLLAGIFVRSYLEELPPREREVALLAFVHDLTPGEIARLLHLTPGAVRATKSRAAAHLRRIYLREAEALERWKGED